MWAWLLKIEVDMNESLQWIVNNGRSLRALHDRRNPADVSREKIQL